MDKERAHIRECNNLNCFKSCKGVLLYPHGARTMRLTQPAKLDKGYSHQPFPTRFNQWTSRLAYAESHLGVYVCDFLHIMTPCGKPTTEDIRVRTNRSLVHFPKEAIGSCPCFKPQLLFYTHFLSLYIITPTVSMRTFRLPLFLTPLDIAKIL